VKIRVKKSIFLQILFFFDFFKKIIFNITTNKMEKDYDDLTDLFKQLEIIVVEKMEMEDDTKKTEEKETEDETKMIEKIINLNKTLEELKLNKIKIPIGDIKFYMKEIVKLNVQITLCNNEIDENLNNFFNLLKKNPARNKSRIQKLSLYLRKKQEERSRKQYSQAMQKKSRKDGRKKKKSIRRKSIRRKSIRRKSIRRKKSRQY